MNKSRFTTLISVFIVTAITITGTPALAKKQKKPAMPPAIVQISKVKQQYWRDEIASTGTLNADHGIMVRSEVAGRVTKVFIESGQIVSAGDPLFQLNPDILKAEVAVQQARVPSLKHSYQRKLKLFKTGAVPQEGLEQSQAALQAAEASLALSQARLAQTLIKAPFAGKLGLKQVYLGDYIQPGQDLINLQDADPMYVDLTVPEKFIEEVKVGQGVIVFSDAFANQHYEGKVFAINTVVDPSSRTIAMRAKIPNPDGVLVPGTFVTATLQVGQPKPVLTVPETAIGYSAAGTYVYAIKNGRAIKTTVRIGARRNGLVSIKNSIKKGTQVVSAGLNKIMFDGAPVMVQPPKSHAMKKSHNASKHAKG